MCRENACLVEYLYVHIAQFQSNVIKCTKKTCVKTNEEKRTMNNFNQSSN